MLPFVCRPSGGGFGSGGCCGCGCCCSPYGDRLFPPDAVRCDDSDESEESDTFRGRYDGDWVTLGSLFGFGGALLVKDTGELRPGLAGEEVIVLCDSGRDGYMASLRTPSARGTL